MGCDNGSNNRHKEIQKIKNPENKDSTKINLSTGTINNINSEGMLKPNPIRNSLTENYYLICPDCEIRSPHIEKLYYNEDLKDFMDEHHIPKADILGFSDGGNIALIFAMHYQERVARLVVDGANISHSGIKRFSQLPVEIAYHMLKPVAGKIKYAHKFMELLSLMVNEPNITPAELGKIRAKTLVVAGTRDLIREQHTRLIAQSIPDAKLVLLPGDHFIARKQWDRFNQVVLNFLLQET